MICSSCQDKGYVWVMLPNGEPDTDPCGDCDAFDRKMKEQNEAVRGGAAK